MATDFTEAATQAVTGHPSTPAIDARKRRFLIGATGVVGGIGAVATAVPFVMSFFPSERAKAAGAPVEVDISKLEAGQKIDVEWRGKVVWLINRTPQMLASLPKVESQLADPASNKSEQPAYAKNEARSIKPSVLVMIGICMLVIGLGYHVRFMLGLRTIRTQMTAEGLIHGQSEFPVSYT